MIHCEICMETHVHKAKCPNYEQQLTEVEQ